MDEPLLQFGPFSLRIDGTLFRHAELVRLPPKELALLRVLVSNPGRIVPLELLRKSAWNGIHVSDESLPRCISSLRAHLGVENCIQTVYKRGYRLQLAVHRVVMGPEDGSPAEPIRVLEGERRPTGASRPVKLVILPFRTLHDVPELLGPGIAEAIMLRIGRVANPALNPGINLVAWDSVLHHANLGLSAQAIGVALNADAVLVGTVTAMPRHLRVRSEMIQVNDHVQLWLEDFLIPRNSGFSIEEQAAERIEAGIAARMQSWGFIESFAKGAFEAAEFAGIGSSGNPAA